MTGLLRAWGPACGSALLRARPEDFRVQEVLGYDPDGDGEHLWLDIEKRGLNTLDVAGHLARCAGVRPSAVGFGGLKDRNAVTVQAFSVHLPGRPEPDWQAWQTEAIRILGATRHSRKIRRGRLAGNRFVLTIREFCGDRDALEQRLQCIAAQGVPNRFGEQRFGGNNVARAYQMFRGELRRPPSRARRGFYLSAARALLFNRVLEQRIRMASWNVVIDGDVLNLDGSRSRFPVDRDPTLTERVRMLDLHPTGPLFGAGDLETTGAARRLEESVIGEHRELADGLLRFGTAMDRRPLRMKVSDLAWEWLADDLLRIEFALPPGGFATTVLSEAIDYRDANRDAS